MANTQTYLWPPAVTNSIALDQSLLGPGNVELNSFYAALLPGQIQGANLFDVTARQISITSLFNNSGTHFTITGLGFGGLPQTDTIIGPAIGTVYSAFYYSQIFSITTDAAADSFQVGTGDAGYTRIFTYNKHASDARLSVTVSVTGTITYSLICTLGTPFELLGLFEYSSFKPLANMISQNFNQFGFLQQPITFASIFVSDGDGGLAVEFLQQGLIS
jgi:hypothetical protein